MSAERKPPSNDSESISQESSENLYVKHEIPGAILNDAELITAQGNVITKDGVVISAKNNDNATPTGNLFNELTDLYNGGTEHIFTDPEVKEFYVGVYEKSKYECRHVFDANLTWTKEEEKKLIRRLDWHGMKWDIAYIITHANSHVQFACGPVSCSSRYKSIAETFNKLLQELS